MTPQTYRLPSDETPLEHLGNAVQLLRGCDGAETREELLGFVHDAARRLDIAAKQLHRLMRTPF